MKFRNYMTIAQDHKGVLTPQPYLVPFFQLQVQANTTEPVGFMIGAHGMDDSCKALAMEIRNSILRKSAGDAGRPSMASSTWTAATAV